jgi:phage gpG-like protein
LVDIGESLLLSHEDRWDKQVSPDGQAWLPLSETYRKTKPQNKDKILVLYGYLKNLHYQVNGNGLELGTDKVYAATQQFGDPSDRPFLGISHDDEDDMIGILEQYFTS